MSELITAANIDSVIKRNDEIRAEIQDQTIRFQMNFNVMQVPSRPQLALLILQRFGLIQIPIEDKFWSGAIFVKDKKIIPVINTALPRVNQYFTAWHEIYHLIFDPIACDHYIENENTIEERKAECFAANILLNNVDRYFVRLPAMDFISKIFLCMSAFQAPYKAVLVSLYEYAVQSGNETLARNIKEVFDLAFENLSERFQTLGLDDSLVKPSYVINASSLLARIQNSKDQDPEIQYHKNNEEFLVGIITELLLLTKRSA